MSGLFFRASASQAATTLSHPPQVLVKPASRFGPQKVPRGSDQLEVIQDKASIPLIRRVLCPQTTPYTAATPRPLQELLPPLTSSNDVDIQLYAIIAIIVKEYVYAWYAKITPDHTFVDEIVQLIAHCTRALEERFRRVNVEQLILDEIPRLVEAHIISYRTAKQGSSLVASPSSLRVTYHSLNPHPALSPTPDPRSPPTIVQQDDNEVAYRQLLARGALAVLLPTEDLDSVPLRTLVEDLLADLILGNQVSGKLCEGWFVWSAICKLISTMRHRRRDSMVAETTAVTINRLELFGLLSNSDERPNDDSSLQCQSRVIVWLWWLLQWAYLVCVAVCFLVTGLFRAALTKPATGAGRQKEDQLPPTADSGTSDAIVNSSSGPLKSAARRPVLDYRLFGMISQLADVPRRMPWLAGMMSLWRFWLLAGPGRFGGTDSILDRFLHQTIQNYILTPTFLPTLLLTIRTALFPMDARPHPMPSATAVAPHSTPRLPRLNQQVPRTQGSTDAAQIGNSSQLPSPPSPSPPPRSLRALQERRKLSGAEIATWKRQCATELLSLMPRRVARSFYCASADNPDDDISPLAAHMRERGTRPVLQTRFNLEQPKRMSPAAPSEDDGGSGEDDEHTNNEDEDLGEENLLLMAIEDDVLDLFADEYCNKHLLFSIIEAILARLLPELSEHGVTELMEDRGILLA